MYKIPTRYLRTISVPFVLVTLLWGFNVSAQNWRKADTSPLDMSYFKISRDGAPIARVIYSRPEKKGRVIFGKLVQYNKLWRTGANEAAEITFYQDVTLAGKAVKAGSYSLFTVPQKDQWTIILSTKLHQWGSYSHQESDEVLRVDVPIKKSAEVIERFSITFDSNDSGANMYLGWDQVMVAVPLAGAFKK